MMGTSIFSPPLVRVSEALTEEQQQRAAALIVSQQVQSGVSTKSHVLMAAYICDGPAGYAVLRRTLKPGGEPDTVEIRDHHGHLLRVDEVDGEVTYDGQEDECGDWPAPCNHDPAHVRTDGER